MATLATSIGPSLRAPFVLLAVGFASALGVTALLLLLPGIALADNCSSLGDCWSTASGAASAAAGAAFGAIGGLFGGGGGSSGGGGAGSTWPEPEGEPEPAPAAPPPPPDRFPNYPFPSPGEEGGAKAARIRVREYWKEIHRGDRPRRTADDAMKDLERVAPKLDLDEESRKWYEETVRKFPTDRAQRG